MSCRPAFPGRRDPSMERTSQECRFFVLISSPADSVTGAARRFFEDFVVASVEYAFENFTVASA